MEDDKFHATALARFDASWSLSKDVREDCHAAGRFCFVPGAQYEGKTQGGSNYEEMSKRFPKFEINKVRAEVLRIVNEYKNSRIAAKFRPGDNRASEDLADKLNGKMLADSEGSAATEAKNNAFTEGVSSGFGCYALSTATEDDDDEAPPQIVFDPIYDATATVWFDTDSKRQNKSDANWAFVMHSLTHEKFKQEYGKDDDSEGDADSMPQTLDGGTNYEYNWTNGNVVNVAQYYERRHESVKFVAYLNPLTGHRAVYAEDQIAAIEDELADIGYRKIDEKTKKVWRVYCSVISGDRVLEKAVRLPGSYIPLIPVYGQRNYLDNVEYITGHVQPSMDSQRLYNFGVSAIAKTAQFGGRAIPIVNDAEVLGFEEDWENALLSDAAYVRLAIPDDVQGGERTRYRPGMLGQIPPVQVPQAVTQLMEVSDSDITATAASGQSNQEVPGNIASETVASFMTRTDMQSYGYMDNMAIAERHMAKVWLSMAREVYGSEQEVRIKRPDGSDEITHLSVQVMDRETGQITAINDLTTGKYDVAIDVGPSFVTQRQATVSTLVELLKDTPPESPYYNVLYAMLIQNVYAPGMEPLKEFNQKQMLLMGIIEPKTPQEAQEVQAAQQQQAQAAQHSPQAVLARTQMIQAVAKARSSMADEMNAKAKILDTITDTWVKEAQAYNYIKGADARTFDSAMNALKTATDQLAADTAARIRSTTSQEMR
ncbi:TPA: portal protein [Klebsiella aerogenes]